ncbi:MAG: peptidase domain-containing protein [Methanoregula sp.]|nr:peptidase domain-containing protein [Methanoregula sp.]
MSKRLGIVALMLLVMASCAVASASELNSSVSNGNYIVVPVHSSGMMHPMFSTGTISQGMTNWHTRVVSSSLTSLNVDLYWGKPSNSLRLKIYSPDGYSFGPYYDSYDGVTDGQIYFYINNPNGIAQGAWSYEVYGDRVTGTQTYSL